MKKQITNFTTIVIVGFFTIIAIASGQKEKENQVAEKSKTEAAIQIASSKLDSEYEANGVAADNKYKDKVLEVSGTVLSIDKNIVDESEIIVKLSGLNEYIGISCYFDASHSAETANLSKGQNVKIKGICDGKVVGVNLKGCSLVK